MTLCPITVLMSPPPRARACPSPSHVAALSSSLDRVALLLRKARPRSVVVLTGAGVSVSSGIPDFRSPGGMYDTLKPELLTASETQRRMMKRDPTAVVSKEIFQVNPLPYLELRRPFILNINKGKWLPTLTHHFLGLLDEHQLLTRCFTQNIDGLDYGVSNLSAERILPVHGSLGEIKCESCGAAYPLEQFQDEVRKNVRNIYDDGTDDEAPSTSRGIACLNCGKDQVKPSTVLYGSALPSAFFEHLHTDCPACDVCLVLGTSLTVGPANSVPEFCESSTRVLVNMEVAGSFGSRATDELLLGASDDICVELAKRLGWLDKLLLRKHDMAKMSQDVLREASAVK